MWKIGWRGFQVCRLRLRRGAVDVVQYAASRCYDCFVHTAAKLKARTDSSWRRSHTRLCRTGLQAADLWQKETSSKYCERLLTHQGRIVEKSRFDWLSYRGENLVSLFGFTFTECCTQSPTTKPALIPEDARDRRSANTSNSRNRDAKSSAKRTSMSIRKRSSLLSLPRQSSK